VIGAVTVFAGFAAEYEAGRIFLGMVLLVCSLIGYSELCAACKVTEGLKKGNALLYFGYAGTVIYYLGLFFLGDLISLDFYTLVMIVLLLLTLMGVYVITFPRFHCNQVMTAVFAFIYCPVLMSFIYRARLLPYGLYIYALIFFTTWICDTCAYFSGVAFGRHKMAPVLSPKKTVEGSVGGIAGSTVLCFLLSLLLKMRNPQEQARFGLAFILIGLIGSAVSEIGDLAASAIKRDHKIKDYGNCIPGHGGIMDRFDSVIFTTPIIYFLAELLVKSKLIG
jgi:phosphatidate cytidylyltransferase